MQMVANTEVMQLVRKIAELCNSPDYTPEVRLRHIEDHARCIIAIATPDIDAMVREQRDPRSLK